MTTLSKEQKEILKTIEELWSKFPEQRLGQLLENYVFFSGERGDKTSVRLFYQQDNDTLIFLIAELRSIKNYGK